MRTQNTMNDTRYQDKSRRSSDLSRTHTFKTVSVLASFAGTVCIMSFPVSAVRAVSLTALALGATALYRYGSRAKKNRSIGSTSHWITIPKWIWIQHRIIDLFHRFFSLCFCFHSSDTGTETVRCTGWKYTETNGEKKEKHWIDGKTMDWFL